MAWIEVHQALLTHRKTLELAELLGLPPIYAAAHVIALWSWSLDNAPDGALHVRAGIIARACQWESDTDLIVSSLVKSGFLDMSNDNCLTIHDWSDYAGRLVDKRRQNAERMREAREKQRATHVQRTLHARAGATVPNPTVPNQLTLNVGANNAPDDLTLWFDTFWQLYPKKIRKPNAHRAAGRIAIRDRPLVIQAVKNYVQSDKVLNGYVKEPPGFLTDDYWRDYVDGPLHDTKGEGNGKAYGQNGADQGGGRGSVAIPKSAGPGSSLRR